MAQKDSIKFELINIIGTISEGSKGWNKQLTRVSWSGHAPKYDLRTWNEDHTKMGKGITLTEEELRTLYQIIGSEIEFLDNLDEV